MKKVEHIGIAVRDLGSACRKYEKLLDASCYKIEEVEAERIRVAFLKVGDTKIALLGSTHPDGPISQFLAQKGEGVHHIAYLVDDILQEMQRLANDGFTLLSNSPKKGADNKMVCYLQPADLGGPLVQLCQEIKWV